MRARYSAFVKHQIEFISKTHMPGTSDFDPIEAEKWAKSSQWDHLEIVKTHKGNPDDQDGIVEFKAFYKDEAHKSFIHHEIAEFKKIEDQWFYADGQIVGTGPITRSSPKVGRNDPCPCGSEKKYKKCCGKL
jgi:SEC-C motif-containing protein